ncbi:MAG: MATE family efflux transporter [Succinivibrionaceae bacterium]
MSKSHSSVLTNMLNSQKRTSIFEEISLVFALSIPAIIAQLSTIIMNYIDSSMVGSLGANAPASIGLIAPSMWLTMSMAIAINHGFTVQVAQQIGANAIKKAHSIIKLGFIINICTSLLLLIIGVLIHRELPIILGGNKDIIREASIYFLIFALGLPISSLNHLVNGFIQSSGNMKHPSMINIIMCCLDVLFNFMLIYPSRTISTPFGDFFIVGANMGVCGAALATVLAFLCGLLMSIFVLLKKCQQLHFWKTAEHVSKIHYIRDAFKISYPIGLDHILMCGAMIVSITIVAPLGTISIAAHSFAITAESFCYMVGFGIATAATTIIGQTIGAKRKKLAVRFAWISTVLGIFIMSITGIIMYIIAPQIMALLSPVPEIQKLGTEVLRIEAYAEPLYGAAIVIVGALRGAGDTLIPSFINCFSIWCIRLPLSLFLVDEYGLHGIWIAMCVELCARGIFFIIRLSKQKWLKI